MAIELGRRVIDGAWKTGAHVESEGASDLIIVTAITAESSGVLGGPGGTTFAAPSTPFLPVYGTNVADGIYSVAAADASAPLIITDAANAIIKAYLYLVGDSAFPPVREDYAALLTDWGANPADVWDISYSTMMITCIVGTDAGKVARLKLDQDVTHPLAPRVLSGGSSYDTFFPWDSKSYGELGITIPDASGGVKVANAGTYMVAVRPVIDVFYPGYHPF